MPPKVAPVSEARPKTPEEKNIDNIAKMTKAQLYNSLKRSKVKFVADALKPELQANWGLWRLGLFTADGTTDGMLLEYAMNWFSMPVEELVKELHAVNHQDVGNKWNRIEALIRYEYETPESEKQRVREQNGDNGEFELGQLSVQDTVPSGTQTSSLVVSQEPDPSVLNLLITLIYDDTVRNPDDEFPGYPEVYRKNILAALDKITLLKTVADVKASLQPLESLTAKLLDATQSTEGAMLAPATGDMIMPGFNVAVQQFIVVKPPSILQNQFNTRMEASNGESLVLFHGTGLHNLRSIILKGLLPMTGLLWAAEHPHYSWNFAWRRFIPGIATWGKTPFKNWGVLLGIEVAGAKKNGTSIYTFPPVNSVKLGKKTVIEVDTVMVRYVFLLPPPDTPQFAQAPPRDVLEPALAKAFKKIHAFQATQN